MSVKEMESDATPPGILFVLKTSFFAKKIQKEMRKMTEEQKNFLISIGINPNDDLDKIDDLVSDYLVTHCLDEKYNPNEEGIMCESILDYIGEN